MPMNDVLTYLLTVAQQSSFPWKARLSISKIADAGTSLSRVELLASNIATIDYESAKLEELNSDEASPTEYSGLEYEEGAAAVGADKDPDVDIPYLQSMQCSEDNITKAEEKLMNMIPPLEHVPGHEKRRQDVEAGLDRVGKWMGSVLRSWGIDAGDDIPFKEWLLRVIVGCGAHI